MTGPLRIPKRESEYLARRGRKSRNGVAFQYEGSEIEHLQKALLALGYSLPEHGADGLFGRETTRAVRAFQKAPRHKDLFVTPPRALLVDGIVGPKTALALNRALARAGIWFDEYKYKWTDKEGDHSAHCTSSTKCTKVDLKKNQKKATMHVSKARMDFMILFPALGLPAIALRDKRGGLIDVIALVKKNSSLLKAAPEAVKKTIAQALRYTVWSKKNQTFKKAKTIKPNSIQDLTWVSVERKRTPPARAGGWIRFDDSLHELTLRMSDLALDKFSGRYETTKVLRFHISLPEEDGLYNLVNRFDESSFVRSILNGLTSPGKHRTDTSGKTLRAGEDIRVYHPFLMTGGNFLNIAHVTDVHVSTHWELYERVANKKIGKGIYNNYNTRFKEILMDINGRHSSDVDIVIITGDLIEYNRGHRVNLQRGNTNTYDNNRDRVKDYLFNRNWILFYELLVENYEKPVFTLLGNHEYLLNPYPTYVKFEIVVDTGGPWRIPIGGYPPVIVEIPKEVRVDDLMQSLWNKSTTQNFGGDMNLTGEDVKKLDGVTSRRISLSDARKLMKMIESRLTEDSVEKVEAKLARFVNSKPELKRELEDPDSGIWFTCEQAVLWYHLVINPFKDYAFSHKEMAFLMVDWNVTQNPGTLLLLPKPTNCLSPEQMKMVDELGSTKRGDGTPKCRIFSSHAPMLSPWPELGNFYLTKARKKTNHDQIREYPFLKHNSEKFSWGALKESSRLKLIRKILSFPIHLCLFGHSHTNKAFQIVKKGKGKKAKRHAFLRREKWNPNLPVVAVTTSGGPIGRTCEASEWDDLIPPAYRIVTFDNGGKISSEPIPLVNVYIRGKVRLDAVKNDPGSKLLRHHDIDRIVTFSSSLPSSKIPSDHSVSIDKVSGTRATIRKLDDGRAIVVRTILSGAALTIKGNDGTIVVQRNKGRLVIDDNDDIVNVDENLGKVIINKNVNAGKIIIHENGRAPGQKAADEINQKATVEINSNGRLFSSGDVVRVYDNFGTVNINPDKGNRDTVIVRRNHGIFNVGYNNKNVEIGINNARAFVFIFKNTGGVKDSEIFISENKGTVSIRGNEGNIYMLDNNDGTLEIEGNLDTIEVNKSKKGDINCLKRVRKKHKLVSESKLQPKFKGKDRGQQPKDE